MFGADAVVCGTGWGTQVTRQDDLAASPIGGLAGAAAPGIGADLRSLLEAYERSVILAALGAVGGRQRSAAALLRVLPGTLHEKMKRLGIRPERLHKPMAAAASEVCSVLSWKGTLPPGCTLELRGLNGLVRIEICEGEQIEVSASRRGRQGVSSPIEVKVLEHERGTTICAVCPGPDAGAAARLPRHLSRAIDSVRVDIVARVPPGVHVVATTINGDVEVRGPASSIEAEAANGRVRLVPAQPPLPQAAHIHSN
jgi:hypothetical protein